MDEAFLLLDPGLAPVSDAISHATGEPTGSRRPADLEAVSERARHGLDVEDGNR